MALMATCVERMQPSVDVKTVMSQLMERLSKYSASSPEVIANVGQREQNFHSRVMLGVSHYRTPHLPTRAFYLRNSLFLMMVRDITCQ